MTDLHWSTDAEADVDRITDYISQHDFIAAVQMRDEIETRVKLLTAFPKGWKMGRLVGTREMVLVGTPYIAVYRIDQIGIEILRVLHGKQQWPPADH